MSSTFATSLESQLAYGGDYNPEQWPAETVAEDIRLMQEAGVNLVSVGIFSWAKLEPEEGHYDFAWLREIMDQLHAGGIGVDLATTTASPPAWMARKYPETLPVTAQGIRLDFGSRQQYSPFSAKYRDASAALVRALATHFADHPALKMWHVGNETGCHVPESYEPAAQIAFQEFLAQRYNSIDELNEAWGTAFWSQTYTSFAQITPPAAQPTFPNPGQMLDWRRCCDAALADLYRQETEILHEITPNIPVTTNFMGLHLRLNYWEWAKIGDFVADDSYPDPADPHAAAEVAFTADLARSLGKGAPFLLMEQSPSAIQWRNYNSPKRPGQMALWSYQRIAHGADGILFFQWRQSRAGSEMFHSGMVPHGGKESRTWKEIRQLGQNLPKLTPVLGGRVNAKIAILVDWESLWAREVSIGPHSWARYTALRQWHRSCWEAGYAVDFAHPSADLQNYQLVVVPELFAVAADLAPRLQEAARAGAHIIITGPTAVVDHNLHAYLGGYLGPLRELAGVKVLDHAGSTGTDYPAWDDAPEPQVDWITGQVATPAAHTEVWVQTGADSSLFTILEKMLGAGGATGKLKAYRWAEEIALTDPATTVQAVFAADGATKDIAGFPAITRRPEGTGMVWYIGTDLASPGRIAVVKAAAKTLGLGREVAHLPRGVEALRRGPVLFVLNHSDRPADVVDVAGTDLLSGKEITGRLRLGPQEVAALLQN